MPSSEIQRYSPSQAIPLGLPDGEGNDLIVVPSLGLNCITLSIASSTSQRYLPSHVIPRGDFEGAVKVFKIVPSLGSILNIIPSLSSALSVLPLKSAFHRYLPSHASPIGQYAGDSIAGIIFPVLLLQHLILSVVLSEYQRLVPSEVTQVTWSPTVLI